MREMNLESGKEVVRERKLISGKGGFFSFFRFYFLLYITTVIRVRKSFPTLLSSLAELVYGLCCSDTSNLTLS